jgi:HPt (histidine-containing phosphotransfer) domain-containing protein
MQDSGAPIFDRESFLEKLDGDLGVAAEIVALFLEDSARGMEQIRRAAATADWPTLRREAHSIKGAVGNFGTGDAYQAALGLEQAAGRSDATSVPGGIAALEAELGKLRPVLLEFQAEAQPVTGS